MEEYFAAYIELSSDCDPIAMVKELQSHGADFIFLDMRKNPNSKQLTNSFDIPVFLIEYSNSEYPFDLLMTDDNKRYINIFFRMKDNYD